MTKNTIEEQIHALGKTKLALDDRVAGVLEGDVDEKKAELKAEKQGAKLVEEMMIGKISEELQERAEDKEKPRSTVNDEMLDI